MFHGRLPFVIATLSILGCLELPDSVDLPEPEVKADAFELDSGPLDTVFDGGADIQSLTDIGQTSLTDTAVILDALLATDSLLEGPVSDATLSLDQLFSDAGPSVDAFTGGLADGETCGRDEECESGLCSMGGALLSM